jgi:hypothetical protein
LPSPRSVKQREHLRLAASILTRDGEEIASLANLVSPESFKKVLRYYHSQAKGEPNAFVIGVAKTLIQVAQYHTGATSKEVSELKRIAGNLPAVPFDLTEKNPEDSQFEVANMLNAKLLPLPSIWGRFAGGPGTNPADGKFIDDALKQLLSA